MKICDLNTGTGQLAQALSELKQRWAEVKTHWNDDASRQFEQMHVQQLPTRLQLMVAAVQRLAAVVESAERELADRSEEG